MIDMRQRSWWKNGLIEREPSEVANINRITSSATEKKRRRRIVNSAYLDHFIPATGHDNRVLDVGAESHARHPIVENETRYFNILM